MRTAELGGAAPGRGLAAARGAAIEAGACGADPNHKSGRAAAVSGVFRMAHVSWVSEIRYEAAEAQQRRKRVQNSTVTPETISDR